MSIIEAIKSWFPLDKPVEVTGMPRIYYWQAAPKDWRWHLKAANNEVQAQGEGYTTKASVLRGIEGVRRNFAIAEVQEREAQ
jgi:uncharacterized protein YegP (UPF0339 family)